MTRRTRLDRLVVLDLEMTCWEDAPPEGQRPEIISIGAVELVLDGVEPCLGRTLDIPVRPETSSVSEFCTLLTGITPTMARRGRPFPEACATLRKSMGGVSKTWGGWGDDRTALAEAAARHGILPPLEGPYVDLGALWGMLTGASRAVGLRTALRMQDMDFQGTPHRALDDAINAARVVAGMASVLRNAFCPVLPMDAVPAEPSGGGGSPWAAPP